MAMQTMSEELEKDDLKTLINVMEVISSIEARTLETDKMFEPLKEIVSMLKDYKFEFEERVLMQVKYIIKLTHSRIKTKKMHTFLVFIPLNTIRLFITSV